MKLIRQDFLNRVLAVSPGVSKSIQQSQCVVFRRGRIYSMSREIACSIPSGLSDACEAAIPAETLTEVLKRIPDEEVGIEILNGVHVEIKSGKGRRSRVTAEEQITLPVGEVKLPYSWDKIPLSVSEGIGMVWQCAARKGDLAKQCVHVHPSYLEASDNHCLMRFYSKLPIRSAFVIRGTTLRSVAKLGMTGLGVTENHLHFRNPLGLRISLTKWDMNQYPDFSKFLDLRGLRIELPKLLIQMARRAELFANEETGIHITLANRKLLVEAANVNGNHIEPEKIDYDGQDLSFFLPPSIVEDLLKKSTTCEITDKTLRVEGESYVYVASLEV